MAFTWNQVRDVVDEVLQLAPEKRSEYLEIACTKPELRRYVESLILSYEKADGILDRPVAISTLDFGAEEQSSSPSLLGQRLGPFEIVEKIGAGGMGVVYRAARVDENFEQQVAIKLLRSGFHSDFTLARFRSERQILAKLQHPNIARLLDGGTTSEGQPYFVMELIEGEPIDQYCDAHKLSILERLHLFRVVCGAVHYAHQNLVIHRDIKPGNILVTAEGVPKLLDFGIAKILDPVAFPREIEATVSWARMLTPEYASPEQVRGDPITTASDVYSLGVLLYRLLTGHPPYCVEGRPAHEVVRTITETEPVKPSLAIERIEASTGADGQAITLTPELVSRSRNGQPEFLRRRLSGDLDNIVLKALRKEPDRRYSSVDQFSEDIRRHLEDLPVLARQDTIRYRTGKFVLRHKASVLTAALAVITLIVGILGTSWEAHIARLQRARAEQRFNDVRKLANSLVFEVYNAIKDLPGATPARKLLVGRALEYLNSLSHEAAGDPSLQSELATAYERVGDVQGNPNHANLGDISGALDSYRKALLILESLRTVDPNNVRVKRQLSFVYYDIGSCLDAMGDYQGALQNSRKALAVDEALVGSNDPTDIDNLAGDYNDIGNKLQHIGDLPASLESYRRAADIREKIKVNDPNQNIKVQIHLASDYQGQGMALAMEKNFNQAIPVEQRTVAILKGLSERNPDNAPLRFSLGQTYETLGLTLEKTGDLIEALQAQRQALAIFQNVSAADPTDELTKRFLGFSYGDVGRLLIKSHDVTGGLENLQKSLAIFKSLPSADQNNDFALSGMAGTCTGMGMAHAALAMTKGATVGQQLTHWREARSWYQKSLDIWLEMRSRGALARVDADKPQDMAGEIAQCDAAIAKLHGSHAARLTAVLR
jgi:non-specific serine/threonine protein kinase/serine/threonine-protein kinase